MTQGSLEIEKKENQDQNFYPNFVLGNFNDFVAAKERKGVSLTRN